MRHHIKFLEECTQLLGVVDLADLLLDYALQIQFDETEVFFYLALLHQVEPQGLQPAAQGNDLHVLT